MKMKVRNVHSFTYCLTTFSFEKGLTLCLSSKHRKMLEPASCEVTEGKRLKKSQAAAADWCGKE